MTLFVLSVLFALACVVVYDALVTGAQAEQLGNGEDDDAQ